MDRGEREERARRKHIIVIRVAVVRACKSGFVDSNKRGNITEAVGGEQRGMKAQKPVRWEGLRSRCESTLIGSILKGY